MRPTVAKVVSGGQTGADRGGLDAAIELGIPHGGWCPRGRRAEDGRIPERYALVETRSPDYDVRTERNVRDSDATVVFTSGEPEGGSALTVRLAGDLGRPCRHVDLASADDERLASALGDWLAEQAPRVLNVAGSRESRNPGVGARVRAILVRALMTRSSDGTTRGTASM
jgi:hypothetical protein